MPEWSVDLAISGAIRLSEDDLELWVLKGENQPFRTEIRMGNARHGVELTIIAKSQTAEGANDAAVYFVGRMLDVLCLRLNIPLYLSLFGPEFRSVDAHVRRIISVNDWEEAFALGREYGIERPIFARALSWYRKGLTSEDPTDKFLAFWNSLEVVSSKYARKNERTDKGIINQVCDCFDQLWVSHEKWKVISSEANKVNEYHDVRNAISHGFLHIEEVENIREITRLLPEIRSLAYAFLHDWEAQGEVIEHAREDEQEQH